MVKERCQKKSFQDSLEDIKKRMKEKRNKNLAEIDRRKSFIVAPCQVPTNASTLLKNYQDNNRLLVLALENEKSKVREAQDIILNLRRECYYLTCQLYTLKERLTSRQHGETVQDQKGCPSEVVSSNNSTPRDFPVKTLQPAALEETDWPFQTEEPNPTVSPDTLGSDCDSGNVESTDNALPRTVSFHRHLQENVSNLSHSTALGHEASQWVGQPLEVRSGCKDLTLHKLGNVGQNVCLWNKGQTNLSLRPTYPRKIAKVKEVILPSNPQEMKSKHKHAQKRRAERKRAKQRCKSKSSLRCKDNKRKDKQAVVPPAPDGSMGPSDTYNFNLEECVHLTPFRQKMSNGSSGETNSNNSEVSSEEVSDSEDDSDELYLPPCKDLQDYTRELDRAVTRPRSKRGLKFTDEKEMEDVSPTRTPVDTPPETQESPHCRLKDVTNILLYPVVKIKRLSLSPKRNENSPAVPLPKRRCTTITSYKEPKLTSKLRRGDPFTDLCFLNSPIFKQKKNVRRPKRSTEQT
ncbi:shugoshin 1-like [Acomys russatus]|uniref:shugoshin 1-like n=1 Tax=Acomys russatus TaxID=60746 RepID=UPI0021E1F164|nr:shugoshin 1-like [Acomys russatus]